jgi:hypothetical protein
MTSTIKKGVMPLSISVEITFLTEGTTHSGSCSPGGHTLRNVTEYETKTFDLGNLVRTNDKIFSNIHEHLNEDGTPNIDYLDKNLGYDLGMGIRCGSGYGCGASATRSVSEARFLYDYGEESPKSIASNTISSYIASENTFVDKNKVKNKSKCVRVPNGNSNLKKTNAFTIDTPCRFLKSNRCRFGRNGNGCRFKHIFFVNK